MEQHERALKYLYLTTWDFFKNSGLDYMLKGWLRKARNIQREKLSTPVSAGHIAAPRTSQAVQVPLQLMAILYHSHFLQK